MPEPALALLQLYDGVVAQFTADGTAATSSFGWKEPDRQRFANVRRVIWVPGDDSSTDRFRAGQVRPPRDLEHFPRHLANFDELCTVYCSAADVTALTVERSQYVDAILIFHAFYRACYLCYNGRFNFREVHWATEKKERSFGVSIRVILEVYGAIPDVPLGSDFGGELVKADTADVSAEVLDPDDPPNIIHTIPTISIPED